MHSLFVIVVGGLQPSQLPAAVPARVDLYVFLLQILIEFLQFAVLELGEFCVSLKNESFDLAVFSLDDVIIRLQALCRLVLNVEIL